MLDNLLLRTQAFEAEAHEILSHHESSKSRTIMVEQTYSRLKGLSIKQDGLFKQAIQCLENGLYLSAHVMAWAAFMDFDRGEDGGRQLID